VRTKRPHARSQHNPQRHAFQPHGAGAEAQKAVAALRPRADELIGDVMDDLRYNLRKLDPPTQRRIMRTYGATFVALPGEPADPTPPPTAPEGPSSRPANT
jgi:hypothetical protein